MCWRLRYLWAFLLAAAIAVLLRGLYTALPCPATAVLSPIRESPWELSKLAYWPLLCGMLPLWRLEAARDLPPGGYCAAVLSGAVLMIPLCRFMGMVIPLYGVFCIAAAGALMLHRFILRRFLPGGGLFWYLLSAFWGVAYLLLTALPPCGGIFSDPRDVAVIATIPF